jgi:hypothetical protein
VTVGGATHHGASRADLIVYTAKRLARAIKARDDARIAQWARCVRRMPQPGRPITNWEIARELRRLREPGVRQWRKRAVRRLLEAHPELDPDRVYGVIRRMKV